MERWRSGDAIHFAALFKYFVLNAYEGDECIRILKERQRHIRTFVRCIIDEHNSALKEMGLTNTTSLCRISSVCSKPNVVMAQQRAASHAHAAYSYHSLQCSWTHFVDRTRCRGDCSATTHKRENCVCYDCYSKHRWGTCSLLRRPDCACLYCYYKG